MKVRFTKIAFEDVQHLALYTQEQFGVSQARVVMQSIQICTERLAAFPGSGTKGRVSGTRELFVPNTPFVLVYRSTAQHLEVVACIHRARKWPQHTSTHL